MLEQLVVFCCVYRLFGLVDIYSALFCETKWMNFGVRLHGCSELSKPLSKCLPRMQTFFMMEENFGGSVQKT